MTEGKLEIAQILMKRDGISFDEASDLIQELQDEINECIENEGSHEDIEELLNYYLGLEPDYLIEFI